MFELDEPGGVGRGGAAERQRAETHPWSRSRVRSTDPVTDSSRRSTCSIAPAATLEQDGDDSFPSALVTLADEWAIGRRDARAIEAALIQHSIEIG